MKALAQPMSRDEPIEARDDERAETRTHDTLEAALKFASDWSRYRLACAGGGLYRVGPDKR